jgi:hypothetical protein
MVSSEFSHHPASAETDLIPSPLPMKKDLFIGSRIGGILVRQMEDLLPTSQDALISLKLKTFSEEPI